MLQNFAIAIFGALFKKIVFLIKNSKINSFNKMYFSTKPIPDDQQHLV